MKPSDLDTDDLAYLADLHAGIADLVFVERPSHSSQRWMAVHNKLDIELAVEFAETEDAVKAIVRSKRAAYSEYLLRHRNGVLHCESGPAVIKETGIVEWWKDGVRVFPEAEV